MQKSGFPKMRHYVGFSQIGSQFFMSNLADNFIKTVLLECINELYQSTRLCSIIG